MTRLAVPTPRQQEQARLLLQASGLPLEGLDGQRTEMRVLVKGDRLVGCVGWEAYPEAWLLRSLAVVPEERGRGLGNVLLEAAIAQARHAGVTEVFGLTTTIPDWLLRLGFKESSREALPASIRESPEFQGACPASARLFRRHP